MRRDEFILLVDRHGPDLATWPEGARADAESLLGTSDSARRLLAEAQAADRLLRGNDPAGILTDDRTARLVARTIEAAGDRPRQSGIRQAAEAWLLRIVLPIGLSAAAGFAVGLLVPVEPAGSAASVATVLWSLEPAAIPVF